MKTVINKITGEVIEINAKTYEQLIDQWRFAQELERVGKQIKDELKDKIRDTIGVKNTSEPLNGFQFRATSVQRYTYDKSVMRDVLDEDIYDLLLKPDKVLIDQYIKENLEELGDDSTRLRQAMIEDGKPYEVIRLEKVAIGGVK